MLYTQYNAEQRNLLISAYTRRNWTMGFLDLVTNSFTVKDLRIALQQSNHGAVLSVNSMVTPIVLLVKCLLLEEMDIV